MLVQRRRRILPYRVVKIRELVIKHIPGALVRQLEFIHIFIYLLEVFMDTYIVVMAIFTESIVIYYYGDMHIYWAMHIQNKTSYEQCNMLG